MSGVALLSLGLEIDLNQATVEDLIALPGIGPVLARRIQARAGEKPFSAVEELVEISGIGPKKMARVRRLVSVGQAANMQQPPSP